MKEVELKEEISREEAKDLLNESYRDLLNVLEKYLVLKEEQYKIIALWIIGTYFHSQFQSYPYLFFNAMKGSGKSRSMRLVTHLSKDGRIMLSPTEATLFRTTGTLGIDEFEKVANKDKGNIRELLNASYKKGSKVMRMKKKKTRHGEEQVVEEFDIFRPITMANIWGMEEVLGDRCISLILDKSNDPSRTKLIEDFDNDELCKKILKNLKRCSLCSVVSLKNIYIHWNNYIIDKHKTTLTTYTTYTTLTTLTTPDQEYLFKLVDASEIYGRNLELFLPLFLVTYMIDFELVPEIIDISKNLIEEVKHEEEVENKDILLIEFISKLNIGIADYFCIKELTNKFKSEYDLLDDEDSNPKWFGRALKRLNLIIDKKRKKQGIVVLVNAAKAKEKLKMFRTDDKNEEK